MLLFVVLLDLLRFAIIQRDSFVLWMHVCLKWKQGRDAADEAARNPLQTRNISLTHLSSDICGRRC